MRIKCKLKLTGCEGSREVTLHGRINKSRIVKACRSCLKKRAVQYQQEYREKQKASDKKAVKPRRPYRPRHEISDKPVAAKICCRCKEKIQGPNYRFCPPCHALVSRSAGEWEENPVNTREM